MLVVSPHLDDAVFACGDLIAAHPGTRVVTVFAGGPPPGDRTLRGWDADCGFSNGDDVIAVRRAEDRAALTTLAAEPIWLSYRDDQYSRDSDVAGIAAVLARVIDVTAPRVVLFPLGIFHRDHALAHEAALLARTRCGVPTWIAYEDAVYRRFAGETVETRLAHLRAMGLKLERLDGDGAPASPLKRRAIACYRSQLMGLATAGRAGQGDAFASEAFWRLR